MNVETLERTEIMPDPAESKCPPKKLNGYPVIAGCLIGIKDSLWKVMVHRKGHECHEWVVATWGPQCKSEWMWGYYFRTHKEALEFFGEVIKR